MTEKNAYHLLLVDDDIHSIDCVKSGINWGEYSIEEPQVSYNIRQAKEILKHGHIDIMVCDIEMPQGDGLELLEWINEQRLTVEVIFLTCHADFKYAQRAIHLGSHAFLLKPVPFNELIEAVVKAQDKIIKERETIKYEKTYRLWKTHQPRLVESFWIDLLHQDISSNQDQLQRLLKEREIPYTMDTKFVPVLVSVQRWHKPLTNREQKIMEYALRNALEEVFIANSGIECQIVQERDGSILVFIDGAEGSNFENEQLKKICQMYIQSCNLYFYCDISCYIGVSSFIYEARAMVESLYQLEANNVNLDNRVFLLNEKEKRAVLVMLPDMNAWFEMLKLGSTKELMTEINYFFDGWMLTERLDPSLLHELYQDFMQMIHYTLRIRGLQAHQILSGSVAMKSMVTAIRTVTDLREWVITVIQFVRDHLDSLENSQSVIEKVKHYIDINLNHEISREDIAKQVFLNADYLNRIFKKETGLPISEYILQQRMKTAKELLIKTEIPISNVATSVGYSNLPYFSKMFKKVTQMSPQDFRQCRQPVNF
ncbi:response regulator transcription factor [Paenibacillus planticolens]|uniref:Response regulator n=1 Tax=Paenibacillus planticolens TaxID=2654976 RepID=A0ABX1ZZS2_9BACL|nr:helix-turn-helix domain-containing protein [Paenibacillus planticolens]NOV04233.1 response regulator [Paenibacillus planticolens]